MSDYIFKMDSKGNIVGGRIKICNVCENLEDGDTLYQLSDRDGGIGVIGFDYIRDIHYCPKCGRKLKDE